MDFRREGHNSWAQSRLFGAVLSAYRLPSRFRASESCVGCGHCVRACPSGNVRLSDERPRWGGDCVYCLGCFHACPAKAVNIGDYTRTLLRYRHPSVSAADLLYRG